MERDITTREGPKTYFSVPLANKQHDVFRKGMANLSAFQRHQKFVKDYMIHYGGNTAVTALNTRRTADDIRGVTELDVLKQHHKFLRTEEDDADTSWEARIAKKYYDKLFKEYCIADLSRYKEGKVAMRWRTQKEVVEGRGQFTCGSIHCTSSQTLRSWEVKFAYLENGERKNALVKLRLCPECSYKLNYRKIKEQEAHEKEAKRRKKRKEKSRKKRRKDEYEEDDVNIHREGDGEDDRRRKGKGRRHNEAGSGSESESEQEGDEEQKAGDGQSEASRIWGAPLPEAEPEKSRAEELDDYFEGLFQ